MYKFRTLKYNYDDRPYRSYMKAYVRGEFGQYVHNKETFKPAYDREITKIGHILRKTSLDELPQLINVLKGEMSIVGPRPNVSWEVDAYYYWHHERLEVLPGITGLAQVRGRSCIDFNTLVRYDIEYIENQSLLLDLKILWWTFTSVLFGKGAG
jgi:undecaprenyl-phosphate galactose phosphotransferase